MTDLPDLGEVARLDDVIHHRVRLAIALLLDRYVECEFAFMKSELGLTDGNLGSHLNVLAGRGYLQLERRPAYRGTRTWAALTPAGKGALSRELSALELITQPRGEALGLLPGVVADRG